MQTRVLDSGTLMYIYVALPCGMPEADAGIASRMVFLAHPPCLQVQLKLVCPLGC